MDSKTFGQHKPGNMDSSGLRSANDMTDSCPEVGWTASDNIPGVDEPGGVSLNTAGDSVVDFSGSNEPGQPFTPRTSGPVADGVPPLAVLLSADEPMGPNTGAGLRSAVDEQVNFKRK